MFAVAYPLRLYLCIKLAVLRVSSGVALCPPFQLSKISPVCTVFTRNDYEITLTQALTSREIVKPYRSMYLAICVHRIFHRV